MINAIAIDDEPVALEVIKRHAEIVPFLDLKETFLSAKNAFDFIKAHQIDLVFLDIAMPGLSGLEFAAIIKQQVQVIFTTAYPEYALDGFELAATDYLLKPINFNRFLQACQLAETRTPSTFTDTIFVKDGYKWVAVLLSELLYVKGEDNYASLVMKDRKILTRITLTELEKKLPAKQFLRVQKSFIISLAKIEKLEKHQVTISGEKIPLSIISIQSLLKRINKPID